MPLIKFNQFTRNAEDHSPEYYPNPDTSEYGDVSTFLKSDVYQALSFYSDKMSRKIIIRFDDWLLYQKYKRKEQEEMQNE